MKTPSEPSGASSEPALAPTPPRPTTTRVRRVRATRDDASLLAPTAPVDVSNDSLALEVTPGSVRLVARGAVAWALAGAAVGAMAVLLAGGRAR